MPLVSMLVLVLGAEPDWKKLDSVDGISVFSRELPDERCVELMVTALTRAPIEQLCEAAFGPAALDPNETEVISRKLISESPDAGRVTYEQVSPVLGSNRDYAVLARKELSDGRCKTSFVAANQFAPPRPDGYVRIEKLHGGWEFVPTHEGPTRATYRIFADPGGAVPAVFVEGTRRRAALKWFKLVLERASGMKPR